MPPPDRVRQRFWARIEILGPDDCWVWTGPRDADRFGVLVEPFDGLTEAHEAAWYFVNGPVPDGLSVLHYCENPPCCNPKHLFAAAETRRRSPAVGPEASGRHRRRMTPATRDRLRLRLDGHDLASRRFV